MNFTQTPLELPYSAICDSVQPKALLTISFLICEIYEQIGAFALILVAKREKTKRKRYLVFSWHPVESHYTGKAQLLLQVIALP